MAQGNFQSQVYTSQAPAVVGAFASKNPRNSYLAGPGGLVAGSAGVLVGHFAWATAPVDGDGAPATVFNTGFGLPSGFVHNEQQALIVNYLASSGLTIQPGFNMTLEISADLWVANSGTTEAEYGMKAYANFADGSVTFAATGSATAGGTSTASTLAAGTSAFTASIADNVMTVSAVGSGTLYNGTTVTGTSVAANTMIVRQLTGTSHGVGTYLLNVGEQTVASESMTGAYGLLTIGGTLTGTYAVGQAVTGSGVTAGMSITELGTGAGGAGTYATNVSQTLSSQVINTALNIETKYYARSTGLPGEIVKMSPTLNS